MIFDGQRIGRTKKLLCGVTNYLNYFFKCISMSTQRQVVASQMDGWVEKLKLSTQTPKLNAIDIKWHPAKGLLITFLSVWKV